MVDRLAEGGGHPHCRGSRESDAVTRLLGGRGGWTT